MRPPVSVVRRNRPIADHARSPIAALAHVIAVYLREHPDAADTAEGVGRWWIPAGTGHTAASVQAALDQLVVDGALETRERVSGPPIYRRKRT